MSEPVRKQLFSTFLGLEEGIHSIILPDVFSPGGSVNLYLDKFGRGRRIDGYLRTNSTPTTTNGGASAAAVVGLAHYKNGAGTTSQLVKVIDDGVNEWEIWTSSNRGVSWAFQSDLGSTPVGILPDFAQFGDNLYITSGKVAPRKWNGSAVSTTGASQSPQPTAVAGSAGLLSGVYQWKLVARMNDFSKKAGSLASAQLSVSLKQGSLSWTADADTNVVGYEVYRTTGTGATYYFVDYVSGRTTVAYTDNVADGTIINNPILETHGDAPPTVYFCEPHKQRMWWGRTDSNPTRLYWSDVGLPESVYSFNAMDFSDSESQGDRLTGLLGNFGGRLLVFTDNAVWTVSGSGALIGTITDWNKQRSSAQTGCVSHRAVCRVPVGARYVDQQAQLRSAGSNAVAYLTPLGDIRLFDGENDEVISHPVKDTVGSLSTEHRAKSHVLHDPARAHFIWFFPSGSATVPNTAVVWNYRWGVWYKWTPFSCASSLLVVGDGTNSPYMLTGEAATATGALVYDFFKASQTSFDGAAFTAQWMTKAIFSRDQLDKLDPSTTSQWRWADIQIFVPSGSPTLTVSWLRGVDPDEGAPLGSQTLTTDTQSVTSLEGDLIQSSNGDVLGIAVASTQRRILLHDSRGDYLNDTAIRLRIANTSSVDPSWALEGFVMGYQPKPGDYRRNQ